MTSVSVTTAGGGVQVGEHPQWHVWGLTINADTVISTAIAAVIVLGCALYLAVKATAGVPSGLQLVFETVTDQIERQVESNVGIRTAPFVVPLAISPCPAAVFRINVVTTPSAWRTPARKCGQQAWAAGVWPDRSARRGLRSVCGLPSAPP